MNILIKDYPETKNGYHLKGLNTKYLNCTRHAVLDFLVYRNIDNPVLYLIESINFTFVFHEKKPSIIDENVEMVEREKIVKEFNNGMILNKIYVRNINDVYRICKDNLKNGNPVLISPDWYYVQGTRFYKKTHNDPHNALVLGIDDHQKKICISDRWMNSDGVFENFHKWVHIHDLERAFKGHNAETRYLYEFKLKSGVKGEELNILTRKILIKSIQNMLYKKSNDSKKHYGVKGMKHMASYLENMYKNNRKQINRYQKEIGTNIFANIVGLYHPFSVFLNYSGKSQSRESLINFAEDINKCLMSWWVVMISFWDKRSDIIEVANLMKMIKDYITTLFIKMEKSLEEGNI